MTVHNSRRRAILRDYFLRNLSARQIAPTRQVSRSYVERLVRATDPWSVKYELRRKAA